MEKTFRCCKSKEFNNYVCVICHNVFHPSCIDRVKDYKLVKGYKIYCSAKCSQTEKNEEKLIKELEKRDRILREKNEDLDKLQDELERVTVESMRHINDLKKELEEKEAHYKREKRRTQDFTDEVYCNEETLTRELNDKNEKIVKLTNQVEVINEKNRILEQNVEEQESKMQELANKLKEFDDLNKEMVNSIKLFEAENRRLENELVKMRTQVKTFSDNTPISAKDIVDQLEINVNMPKNHKKKQLLVVGDNNVKGVLTLLKDKTNYEFDINCQRLWRPSMEEIISKGVKCSTNFDKSDFVIIICSPWDAKKGKILHKSSLLELKNIGNRTNLIIIGAPLQRHKHILNFIIEEQNLKLSTIAARDSTDGPVFVPLAVVTNGGILDDAQKENIMEYITKFLLLNGKKNSVGFVEVEHCARRKTNIVHNSDANSQESVHRPINFRTSQSNISPS